MNVVDVQHLKARSFTHPRAGTLKCADPLELKRLPKCHPYRLAFTIQARLLDRLSRWSYDSCELPTTSFDQVLAIHGGDRRTPRSHLSKCGTVAGLAGGDRGWFGMCGGWRLSRRDQQIPRSPHGTDHVAVDPPTVGATRIMTCSNATPQGGETWCTSACLGTGGARLATREGRVRIC